MGKIASELDRVKVDLFRRLHAIQTSKITDNEIELLYYLSFEPCIQWILDSQTDREKEKHRKPLDSHRESARGDYEDRRIIPLTTELHEGLAEDC